MAEVAASLIVLKLVLTPLLVGGSALVARRWGPAIGGWLIALPLTSGPVLVFVALEQGTEFARGTAVGTVGGLTAICAFCVAYAAAVRRAGPVASVAAAVATYVATGLALSPLLGLSIWAVAAVSVAAVIASLAIVKPSGLEHAQVDYPGWDIPARIVVATALVTAITTWAPLVGPHWSGLVATFPVYLSVLAAFTHVHAGPAAASDAVRGLLGGLFGTVAFYLVVDTALVPLGLGLTVLAAVAAAGLIGIATLGWLRLADAR